MSAPDVVIETTRYRAVRLPNRVRINNAAETMHYGDLWADATAQQVAAVMVMVNAAETRGRAWGEDDVKARLSRLLGVRS